MEKKQCDLCGEYFRNCSLPVHQVYCNGTGRIKKPRSKTSTCKFCGLVLENKSSMGGHTVWCDKNPNRENTLKKISVVNIGRVLTLEHRSKISKTQSKNLDIQGGGFINIQYHEVCDWQGKLVKVRGLWEVDVANWLNDQDILWRRDKSLQYDNGDGVVRTYHPDFYLPAYDRFIEVKGHFSERDKIKMVCVLQQNDVKIDMFFKQQIDLVRKNLSYIKIVGL